MTKRTKEELMANMRASLHAIQSEQFELSETYELLSQMELDGDWARAVDIIGPGLNNLDDALDNIEEGMSLVGEGG